MTSSVMPQPLSVTTISAFAPRAATATVTLPPGSRLSSPLVIRFKHDLLHFLRADFRDHRLARQQLDVFVVVAAEVADHLDDAGHQLAQVGVVPLGIAGPREVEQLLGDLFAAEGFLLNHVEVAADDVAIGGMRIVDALEQLRSGGVRATRCPARSRPADC